MDVLRIDVARRMDGYILSRLSSSFFSEAIAFCGWALA